MPTTSTSHKDAAQRSSSRTRLPPEAMGEAISSSLDQKSESSRATNQPVSGNGLPQTQRQRPAEKIRRRLLRQSGGFLLDPASHEKSAEVRKRSDRHDPHAGDAKQKSRTRDSGSTQASRAADGFQSLRRNQRSPSLQEKDTTYSGDSSTLDGLASTTETRRGDQHTSTSTPSRNEKSRSPLDSESADIVNLALSLNENRRRWFQASSPNDAMSLDPKQRISSSPYMPTKVADYSSGSRHSSGQYGTVPRNGTPYSLPISTAQIANRLSFGANLGDDGEALQEMASPDFRSTRLSTSAIIPSEATIHRVQKAKATLELAYQHRRLLQYLPSLPSTSSALKRPPTKEANNPEEQGLSGRQYNPLQYIRNRRTRFREGCPLNPEAAGWNDVDKVQSWIGRVAEQQTRLSPAEKSKTPLPTFPGPGANADVDLEDKSRSVDGNTASSLGSKPARPRSDWETNPWSLLADAYWTSKEDHHTMLEDRHGDKLFPRPQRERPQAPPKISLDLAPRPSQSSTTRPENNTEANGNRHASISDTSAHERGRAASRVKEMDGPIEHYSSSSDRRPKWPRKILRSDSASSSEEEARRGVRRAGVHRRLDSKDLQERALLEKQLRDWQAQEGGQTRDGGSLDLERSDRKYSLAPSMEPNARGERVSSERHRLHHRRKAQTWGAGAQRGRRGDEAHLEGFDSTAPSSPEHRQSVPNITINLTPPQNNSLGANKRRTLPQRSILAEVEKGLHKIHKHEPVVTHVTTREESKSDSHRGSLPELKEVDEAASFARHHRSESQKHTKPVETGSRVPSDNKEADSRLRGLVRGARIAELVASPMTRVADLIWRREDTDSGKHSSSSYDSLPMPVESSAVQIGNLREALRSESDVSIDSVETAPGYHLSNLPVFKSPFASNRPTTPISRQDRLPRLDTGNRQGHQLADAGSGQLASPGLHPRYTAASPARSIEREGSSDDKERQNSSGRRLAIVDPFVDRPIHDSASPESAQLGSPIRGHRRWTSLDANHGFETPELPRPSLKVTLDQVARLKVVQLSCTIRATELARKAATSSFSTSEETKSLQKSTGINRSGLPDVEQHLYTGSLMAKDIDLLLEQTKTAATKFSSETVTGLHERLNALHGQISDDLTQMARSAEKGADELSAQLATDCTLDIKRLNEALDLIMRRRRRRMRWVRRAGFAALEWMVLITLWWLWLIVVVVRVARGIIRVAVKATQWLLWL